MMAEAIGKRWLFGLAGFGALSIGCASQNIGQSVEKPQTILFGAAYYEEYAPSDRLDEDVRMMKATGMANQAKAARVANR